MVKENANILFEVMTPLGFRVRVTRAYWRIITEIKHPVMRGREEDVKETLRNPVGRWVCAVAKRLNGEGFLITTYPTDAIKEGERWPRSVF